MLVESRNFRCDFADEYIEALKQALDATGYNAARYDCTNFLQLERSQFTTASDFVRALRDAYAKLAQRITMSPFLVIQKLLYGIAEDNHSLVAAKHSTFHERYSNPNSIDSLALFKLFNDILNELRTDETLLATAAVNNDRVQQNNKNQNQNQSEYLPLKNAPPKTMSPWKWVQEWLNGANQKTPNGLCAFCGRPGHEAKTCAHLSVDHRPPNWRPVKGIWVNFPWRNRDCINSPPPENWRKFYDNRVRRDGTTPNQQPVSPSLSSSSPNQATQQTILSQNTPTTTPSDQTMTTPPLPVTNTTATNPLLPSGDEAISSAAISTDYYYSGFASIALEDDNPDFTKTYDHSDDPYDFDANRINPVICYTTGIDQNMPIPLSLATIARSRGEWIVDSGASRSVCVDGDAIIHFEPNNINSYKCQTSEGRTLTSKGRAIARINLVFPDRVENLDVKCEFIPEGPFNLLSTTRTYYDHGMGWKDWTNTFVNPKDESTIMAYAYRKRGVPFLHTTSLRPSLSMELKAPGIIAMAYSMATITPELAHFRLGHIGQPTARVNHHKIAENVEGSDLFDCEACRLAKAKKIISHRPQRRASRPFEFIHVDLQPCKPIGISGTNHLVVVCDDATRLRWTIPIKTKDMASPALIKWATTIYNITGHWPIECRTDGDPALFKWVRWMEEKGSSVSVSPPYTHEQNGVAESTGHIVMQSARTLMIATPTAPAFLWPEAANASVYVLNRIRRPKEELSPIEKWNIALNLRQGPVDLGFLRVWYSKAYVLIPQEQRVKANKMAPRAWIGHLVGYEGENGHVYRIYDPAKRKVVLRRDVAFWEEPLPIRKFPEDADDQKIADLPQKSVQQNRHQQITISDSIKSRPAQETTVPPSASPILHPDKPLESIEETYQPTPESIAFEQQQDTATTNQDQLINPLQRLHVNPQRTIPGSFTTPEEDRQQRETSSTDPIDVLPPPTAPKKPAPRRSERQKTKTTLAPGMIRDPSSQEYSAMAISIDENSYFPPGICYTATERIRSSNVNIPESHKEAMNSKFADQWLEAEKTQLAKIKAANALAIVPHPPPGTSILPGKWVYDLKKDSDGYVLEFRARWVVCGNRQMPGVDFQPDERYSPVVADASAKLFLTLAALRKWKIRQWDIVSAYLNAAIDDRAIFMRQPTGHEFHGPDGVEYVCIVNQALYGLRQAGHLWHDVFTQDLSELGLKPFDSDLCVYTNASRTVFVLIYVDDTLTTGHDEEIDAIQKGMEAKRKLKILPFKRFLGCDVFVESSGCVFMNQQAYLSQLICDENLENTNPLPIPMNPSWSIPREEVQNPEDKSKYSKMMGKIGWLSIKMRPDIASTVSKLQRRASAPRRDDFLAFRDLLKYLAGTIQLGLPFGSDPSRLLEGFVDSSYADAEDGKSTEAYIWFFAGTPISWASRRQDIVASSSTMAEYCAMSTAVKEGLFLAKIAAEMHLIPPLNQDEDFDNNTPLRLHCDSVNAITAVTQGKISTKLSWISTRYHLVRDAMRKNLITLVNIPSKDNPADILTKAKQKGAFENDRDRILHMRKPISSS
jgi:reverse transcriptase-like protein